MEITRDVILRSWKDEVYRESLPADVREALPGKPVAEDGSKLSEEHLENAAGGTLTVAVGVTAIVGGGAAFGATLENSADTCDTKERY